MRTRRSPNKHIIIIMYAFSKIMFFSAMLALSELYPYSNVILTSPQKISNVIRHLFEIRAPLNIVV